MVEDSCHAVLCIPELLETILIYLPMRDLISSNRVSKRFRDTIDHSPRIQRALFFKPDLPIHSGNDQLQRPIAINPIFAAILQQHDRQCTLHHASGKLGTWSWALEEIAIDEVANMENPYFLRTTESYTHVKISPQPLLRDDIRPKGFESWRRMMVSDSPLDFAIRWIDAGKPGFFTQWITPETLEEIVDALDSLDRSAQQGQRRNASTQLPALPAISKEVTEA